MIFIKIAQKLGSRAILIKIKIKDPDIGTFEFSQAFWSFYNPKPVEWTVRSAVQLSVFLWMKNKSRTQFKVDFCAVKLIFEKKDEGKR